MPKVGKDRQLGSRRGRTRNPLASGSSPSWPTPKLFRRISDRLRRYASFLLRGRASGSRRSGDPVEREGAVVRILQSTAKRLKLPIDKLVVTVDQHGNTSAASIPLALDEAVRSGKIAKGDTVLLAGVGGGFTWGAVLLDL